MTYKDIMRIIPTLEAAKLVDDNLKNKKKSTKSFTKQATKNIVGVSLIKTQANIIN